MSETRLRKVGVLSKTAKTISLIAWVKSSVHLKGSSLVQKNKTW